MFSLAIRCKSKTNRNKEHLSHVKNYYYYYFNCITKPDTICIRISFSFLFSFSSSLILGIHFECFVCDSCCCCCCYLISNVIRAHHVYLYATTPFVCSFTRKRTGLLSWLYIHPGPRYRTRPSQLLRDNRDSAIKMLSIH